MSAYEDHLLTTARDAILAIDEKIAADIYALSFYYWADEDDPRRMMLTAGYNTNAHARKMTKEASGPEEAKWNFAFWLQEEGEACVIGENDEDAKAREEWLRSMKLWYSDDEADDDSERCYDLDEKIIDKFVDLCVATAKRLHSDGTIEKKFGRPIPILVHELEYHDGIAAATRKANPKGLAKEFEAWIKAM